MKFFAPIGSHINENWQKKGETKIKHGLFSIIKKKSERMVQGIQHMKFPPNGFRDSCDTTTDGRRINVGFMISADIVKQSHS